MQSAIKTEDIKKSDDLKIKFRNPKREVGLDVGTNR